jgi:hypothetical protein
MVFGFRQELGEAHGLRLHEIYDHHRCPISWPGVDSGDWGWQKNLLGRDRMNISLIMKIKVIRGFGRIIIYSDQ